MHIRKIKSGVIGRTDFFGSLYLEDAYSYAVHYKGFVSSGTDLGACISACYAAATI